MCAEVLLLDEPLASLDPLARREFIDVLLDDVGETGATVVMSSHVVTDVERACDRLVVLGLGRKVLDESIDEIRRTHWVAAGLKLDSATVINPSRSGRSAVVQSANIPAPDAVPASLDDIVMAYLELARG